MPCATTASGSSGCSSSAGLPPPERCAQIAPGLFRAPVVVPTPAEYVGVGAARQAAWALSGEAAPPTWALTIDSEYAVASGTEAASADVVARYTELLRRTHGL